jgi:hypothetical protein
LYKKAEIILAGMLKSVDYPAVEQYDITGMKAVWFGSAKHLQGPFDYDHEFIIKVPMQPRAP